MLIRSQTIPINTNLSGPDITIANIPVDQNKTIEDQVKEAHAWVTDNFSEIVFWAHQTELD